MEKAISSQMMLPAGVEASPDDIARMLESLCTLVQESAEHGEMDSAVYADIAELMGEMVGRLRAALEKRDGASD